MTEVQKRNTRRRGHGEGSIFERSDGRWTATVSLGYDGNGKRVRRSVHGETKREVQEKLAELQQKRFDGTLSAKHRMTVATFWDGWLDDVGRTASDATRTIYDAVGRLHILPYLGGAKLEKLTPLHVRTLLNRLDEAGATSAQQKQAYAVLRRMLAAAVRAEVIVRNVTDAVDAPRHCAEEIHPLTPEQVVNFLAVTKGDRLHPLWALAIHTGARQGELFALKWEDVDFGARTMSIRRILATPHGRRVIKEPKTKRSRRQIDLSQAAIDALVEQKAYLLRMGFAQTEWVFLGMRGEPLQRSNVHRVFKDALKTAALPPSVRFHDLRHTHATLLLKAGVNPKVVSSRLGHSSIKITLDTYSHVLPDMGREAVDRLDELLAKQVKSASPQVEASA